MREISSQISKSEQFMREGGFSGTTVYFLLQFRSVFDISCMT